MDSAQLADKAHIINMKYFCCMAALVLTACCSPIEQTTQQDFEAQLIEKTQNIKKLDQVFDKLQGMVYSNLNKMYYRLDSFKQLEKAMDSDDSSVSLGTVGDMSQRCPQNFVAVPGDRKCYYLSTYKVPWKLAREHCLQLGSEVDMLSIDTTKRQFIVAHLIQSNEASRQVKKWWTSGMTKGYGWTWAKRVEQQQFFYKNWAVDSKTTTTESAQRDSCVILDSDFYYQWRTIKQCGASQNSPSIKELPAHHFICERPVFELPSADSN